MQLFDAIGKRRSIRKFCDRSVPDDLIRRVLEAGILAPSSKNRQPWRFVVVREEAKGPMLDAMRSGISREESGDAVLPGSARHLTPARHTADIMEQAPVTILVLNPQRWVGLADSLESKFYEMADLQSLGACIENMLLTATDLGLGSLWICDIFFAYAELLRWLDTDELLVAAIALGYPSQAPAPSPRKPLAELVTWM